MVAVHERRTNRIVLTLMCAALALPVGSERAHAHDLAALEDQPGETKTIAVGTLSLWLKARFSEAELEGLQPGDLGLESHYCGCYDQPKPHFPYPLVLLKTPRGDLVARPDSREGAVSFTPLAVRHGERYCEVESEHVCYGSFSQPCDFTDFRYGPHLAPFFPTCKSQEVEAVMLPSDAASAKP